MRVFSLCLIALSLSLAGCEKRLVDPCTGSKIPARYARGDIMDRQAWARASLYEGSPGYRPDRCPTPEEVADMKKAEAMLHEAGAFAKSSSVVPQDEKAYRDLRRNMGERDAAAAAPSLRQLCEKGDGSDCR